MPVYAKKKTVKSPVKRRRLTKSTFNMLIKLKTKIDEDTLNSTILHIFDEFVRVNVKRRPDDDLEESIKSMDPSFNAVDEANFQFMINVSSYTVLEFAFSEFALKLSKMLRLPMGYLSVTKLKSDEVIRPKAKPKPKPKIEIQQVPEEEEQEVQQEVAEEVPEEQQVQQEEVQQEQVPEPCPQAAGWTETKFLSQQLKEIIDKEIESDVVPMQIPKAYEVAAETMNDPIPQGKSSLPPMPALENKPVQSFNPESYFSLQNIALGLGGLILGMKLVSPGASVQTPSFSYPQPIFFN